MSQQPLRERLRLSRRSVPSLLGVVVVLIVAGLIVAAFVQRANIDPAQQVLINEDFTGTDVTRARRFSEILGIPVQPVPQEPNQFQVTVPLNAVNFDLIGTVHERLESSVGVTLSNGSQVGFRQGTSSTVRPTATAAGKVAPAAKPLATVPASAVQAKAPASAKPAAQAQGSGQEPAALAARFAQQLGVPVEPIAGEPGQYMIGAPRAGLDLAVLGRIHLDLGYTVGVTLPEGRQVGFRFRTTAPAAPAAAAPAAAVAPTVAVAPGEDLVPLLTRLIGTPVEVIPGEVNQFLVARDRAQVDLSRVGTIHTDVGYAVGVTLADGRRVGFRFAQSSRQASTPSSRPPSIDRSAALSSQLGVPVEFLRAEYDQYLVRVARSEVDVTKVGAITQDLGYAVGVRLADGALIGIRFDPVRSDPLGLTPGRVGEGDRSEQLTRELGAPVKLMPNTRAHYRVEASRNEVDFGRLGTVHKDLTYAVGITLSDGSQLSIEIAPDPRDRSAEFGSLLGVTVEAITGEPGQYLIRAARAAVDLTRIGSIHTETQFGIGVMPASGRPVGFRFTTR